ncbi:MAG: [FeFe] hydrogenase H-cluster radical SAM maturase HydE [Lachnospiraceae bacterium]|nr:[FeFe] hydrogenase H-cluster radical SAM maturase HydE [Lachnospiraceae bacterium]
MDNLPRLIDRLEQNQVLNKEDFIRLIEKHTPDTDEYLFQKADRLRQENYGNEIYIRGLIELTNYCKNDCIYCGIRRSNRNAQRYRLEPEDIMECCRTGYELGFRTFVLQGGEDGWYTDEKVCQILTAIKKDYPDCAVTLSLGERSRESYQAWFDAGADRYLLRHETATPEHYAKLHPPELSLARRMECLHNLKEIGYQTGCGFMVGSPFQTAHHLAQDLLYIHELQPQMVGIGPFIPHHDTPFAKKPAGTVEDTLFYLAIIRLMLPKVLLPATTALGTIDPNGREKGVHAGANVIMPNLSPLSVRKKYMLYDNKISTGEEAAESVTLLKKRMEAIGCQVIIGRGDYKK